jgi:hypothetical protein
LATGPKLGYGNPRKEANMPRDTDQDIEILRREFLRSAGLILAVPAVCAAGSEESAETASAPPGKVELEVLSPMGVIDPPPMLGITPRLKTLEGKKLAMIHNNKAGAKEFLIAVEELLKARYPTATFTHFDTTINLADKPEKYAEMAKSCDAFILGSGD